MATTVGRDVAAESLVKLQSVVILPCARNRGDDRTSRMTGDESESRTRPSLLFRIRNDRDEAAWSLFLDTYAPVVYRYCRRRGLQDSDAADVTQEVMTQIARSVSGFDYQPERGRFRDWLGVIVRNKLTDHLRSARRPLRRATEKIDDPDAYAGAGTDPEWAEEFNAQLYRAALERIRVHFEAASWRAFELTWIEGRSAADAARTLRVPVDSIYVSKSRVLKRLREEIVALADDLPLYTPLG